MTTSDYLFYSDSHNGKPVDIAALFDADHVMWLDGDGVHRPRIQWSLGATEQFRDDLRGGWFVVKEGTRYIAVQGVKAGQRCAGVYGNIVMAQTDARRGDVAGLVKTVPPGDLPSFCTVIDLHDLADRRAPSKAPESRYVVKRAEEMVEGETCLARRTAHDVARLSNEGRLAEVAGGDTNSKTRWPLGGSIDGMVFVSAIIDTQDAWHTLARNTTIVMGDTWAADSPRYVRHKTVAQAPVKAEPVGPTRPSDAAICAQYATMQAADKGWNRSGIHVFHDGTSTLVSMADVRAAWSRVLAAKVQASETARANAERERDRRIVLGPIDDPEEA